MKPITKRIVITVSITAVLVAGSVFAFAKTQRPGRLLGAGKLPAFAERFLNRASLYLGLTDQQEAQIKAILEAEKPTVQPLVMQLAANRKALTEATANGTFNEAQIKAFADKQGDTLAALIVEKERVKTQVYAVLTPEQRQKADQFRQHIEERMKQYFME